MAEVVVFYPVFHPLPEKEHLLIGKQLVIDLLEHFVICNLQYYFASRKKYFGLDSFQKTLFCKNMCPRIAELVLLNVCD